MQFAYSKFDQNEVTEIQRDAEQTHSTPFRVGPKRRKSEMNTIARTLLEDFFKPAKIKCAAPVVFLCKKDGLFRFFVAYQKLNAVPGWDIYPILQMDEWIDLPVEAATFSSSDPSRRYWQDEIQKEDWRKETCTALLQPCYTEGVP